MSDRYALFGRPLGHSKSRLIHGTFAQQTAQDISYDLIEAPDGGFADAVAAFRVGGGRGFNVTMPFKIEAFNLATALSERARRAGAVNAVKIEGDRLLGENFDGVGLVNDVQANLGFHLAGRRVLLLGAGGAARGALLPFLNASPGQLVLANRTVAKAHALGEACAGVGPLEVGGYGDIGNRSFDVIVNATSASMRGELPPVPRTAFGNDSLAYDVVYGKGMTPFLRLARDSGVVPLADGVGMLVEQAAEAFAWWRGVRPATGPVIEALRVPLE